MIRVDQPGSGPTDWLANLANQVRERRPIIHPALRSRREAVATVRWVAAHYRHVALYHLVRVPKYGGKLAVRAPRGFTRTVSGLTRWAYDLEGVPVRMATVLKADPEAYLKMSRQRDSRVRLRVPIAILAGPGRPDRRRADPDCPGPGQAGRARGSGGHLREAGRPRPTGR